MYLAVPTARGGKGNPTEMVEEELEGESEEVPDSGTPSKSKKK